MLNSKSQVSFDLRSDSLIIHVGGEMDHHSAVAVRTEVDQKIAAERRSRVLLDLSSIDFMDSSGLGLIMGRYALVKQYGGSFAVLDPSPAVLRIITLAGMERMLTILRTKSKKKNA